jgi:hypothetical protein
MQRSISESIRRQQRLAMHVTKDNNELRGKRGNKASKQLEERRQFVSHFHSVSLVA